MNLPPPPHTAYDRVLDALWTLTHAAQRPADERRDAIAVRLAAGRLLGRMLA